MSSGGGSPINPFGAIPGIDLKDVKVMEGITYSVRARIPLAISGVANIVFDPRAFTGTNVVVLPLGFDAIGGPITVDLLVDVTSDDLTGTPLFVYNRNQVFGAPPASLAILNPTNFAAGVIPAIEYLIPSDGQGANVSGGASSEPLVANLDFSIKHALQLTNTDSTKAATVGVKFDFFEVPAPS